MGRALYTSLFAALDFQGFYNAYAGATLPNQASVGLHESVGFRPVGVYRGVGYNLGACEYEDIVVPVEEVRVQGRVVYVIHPPGGVP